MTSYIHKHGDQLALVLSGEKYLAVPTGGEVWLLNGVEPGPGPGEPPSSGDQTFDWPFNPSTEVTSEYGPRDGRIHQGIDFGKGTAVNNAEIHAAAQGVCSESGVNSGWGNTMVINHGVVGDRQLYTRYAHMISAPFFTVGQEVNKWDVIGRVGNTGNSFGAHLHWETHIAMPGGGMSSSNPGTHVNPRTFMATYQNVPVPEIVLD